MKRVCAKVQFVLLVCVVVSILNVLCVSEAETSVSLMEETEKRALYSTIQGFVGKWWNGSEIYPDPCGWTPIQGVSCDLYDGFWYVTVLSIGLIHDNSIPCTSTAEFRTHLFQFKHLKTLSFTNCFIYPHQKSISIPSNNWDRLSNNLESLEFRSNSGLIGKIPPTFGTLTKLQSLILVENKLTGELPLNLGNLISLKRIVLAENVFTGPIPTSLGGLTNLLILDFSRNYITGSIPPTLGSMTSLLKLDLSNNYLESKLPSELGNLKNLTLLDLRNNKLSGGFTKSLQEMVSLEQLALSNNPLGGDLKEVEWERLQNLVSLDLSSMRLAGGMPQSITQLTRLRFLGLKQNNLSGTVPPNLESLPSLSALYINGNNLSGRLEFSQEFYRKMRRRFGGWSNPNLCYPVELMATAHVPYGVKPCQKEGKDLETDSVTKACDDEKLEQKYSTSVLVSLGYSVTYGTDRSWWDVIMLGILWLFLF